MVLFVADVAASLNEERKRNNQWRDKNNK